MLPEPRFPKPNTRVRWDRDMVGTIVHWAWWPMGETYMYTIVWLDDDGVECVTTLGEYHLDFVSVPRDHWREG